MPSEPKPRSIAAPSAPVLPDRIILTGFMGSGKTTTGALLATHLGWRFLDLDHEIERLHHRSVPQIFAESGELHFRHLESSTLASLLHEHHIVLALGGGAPEELANRLLLKQTPNTAVVYLSAPFATLLHRCTLQAADPSATLRPNLADPAAAERRFHLRHTLYASIASHTLDTSNLSPNQTPLAILDLLL